MCVHCVYMFVYVCMCVCVCEASGLSKERERERVLAPVLGKRKLSLKAAANTRNRRRQDTPFLAVTHWVESLVGVEWLRLCLSAPTCKKLPSTLARFQLTRATSNPIVVLASSPSLECCFSGRYISTLNPLAPLVLKTNAIPSH